MKRNAFQSLLKINRYLLLSVLVAAVIVIAVPRVALGHSGVDLPDAQEPNAIPLIRGLGRVSTTGNFQLDENWMTVAQTILNTPSPAKLLVIMDFDGEVLGGGGAIAKLKVDGEFIHDPVSGTDLGARIITDSLDRVRTSTSISYLINLGTGTHSVEIVATGSGPGTAVSHDHTGFTYIVVR